MYSSVPSLRSLVKFALGTTQVALGFGGVAIGGAPASCPNPELSCHSSGSNSNTCCLNAPGGQILQTQFWDTNPPTGPSNSWTIHGLWPDNCDGTYEANCDSSRVYTGIDSTIGSANPALLDYMNTYWKDYKGDDETFWEHEWSKHGTCISTLEPRCYIRYSPREELIDYFQKTVDLFKGLDTYKTLAAAGITPSSSQTYNLNDIQNAISSVTGHQVTLGCKSGVFNEVWYHFNVLGSLQTGQFVAADPDGTKSTCPSRGIRYLPKAGSPAPPDPTDPTPPLPDPTPNPGNSFSGKGFLQVSSGGCLISNGKWFTSGTCATYTATASGDGFTLESRKGNCGIVNDAFSCGPKVSSSTFSSDSSGFLEFNGGNAFYSDSVPHGSAKAVLFTVPHAKSVQITWQSV
ncbi:MAG: ribonuclease T2-like [Trizodia sp. TS-e1964]|nr:MAG: ribonuclease T2-like [Trizodia sp. TS-e1964]